MANVTASANVVDLNVSTVTNVINVTDTESNVIVSIPNQGTANIAVTSTAAVVNVSATGIVANSTIREALSAVDLGGDGSFSYDVSTGVFTYTGPNQTEANARIAAAPDQVIGHFSNVSPINLEANGQISVDESAIFSGKTTDDLQEGNVNLYFTDARVLNTITSSNVTLKQYKETVVNAGNLTGNVTLDLSQGSIFAGTLAGNVSGITLANVEAGSQITMILSQDSFGGNYLTSDFGWNWASDYKEINLNASEKNYIGVTYDGSEYYASLVRFDAPSESITINGYVVPLGGNVTLDTSDIQETTGALYLNGAGTTDDLTEGLFNFYYTQNRFDLAFLGKTTDDLTEGLTNKYYSSALANADIAGYTGDLLNIGNIACGNIDVTGSIDTQILSSNTQILTNRSNDFTGYVNAIRHDVGPASTDYALITYDNTARRWAFSDVAAGFANATNTYYIPLTTDDLPEGNTNLYYTDDRVNVAIANYDGNITTTGTITAEMFEGDINGAVLLNVHNNTATRIDKGNVVYLPGGNNGDNAYVENAKADSLTTMPAFGIAYEHIPPNSPGEIVTLGELTGLDMTGFTTGDTLYVSTTVAGAFQNTAPTTEAHYIQSIGKVVKGGGTGGALEFTGAGRVNATPNLDEGALFLGSTSNTSIAVDPSTNFNTLGNAFDLSNTLTNINSIESEPGLDITLNTENKLVITQNVNGSDVYAGNISSSGYALQPGSTETFAPWRYALPITYTNGNLRVFVAEIDTTQGSDVVTIQSLLDLDTAQPANVSDIQTFAIAADVSGGQFSADNYVTAVDAANSQITISSPALADSTLSTLALFPGAVDTNSGLVMSFNTDGSGGIASATPNTGIYAYPQAGPVATDFNWTYDTPADYTFGDFSPYMMAKTKFEAPDTAFTSPRGIVVGEAGDMSENGVDDISQSFGQTILWSGRPSDDSYAGGLAPQTQLLIRNYMDNNVQTFNPSGTGPRIMFQSNAGNVDQSFAQTYARANQELGRLSFSSSNQRERSPDTVSPPAYISVQAANNYDTANSDTPVAFGGFGRAGNADVYYAATSDVKGVGEPDIYMAYQKGQLTLASGSSKGIQFAQADAPNGSSPQNAYPGAPNQYNYTGGTQLFADMNYADTANAYGSKFSVTNGFTVGDKVGDQILSINRTDNSVSVSNLAVTSWANGETIQLFVSFGFTAARPNVSTNSITLLQSTTTSAALPDGTAITLSGALGDAGVTDGNTYYTLLQMSLNEYFYTLYTDAGLTTEASYGQNWTGTLVDGFIPLETNWQGEYDYTVSSGVTGKEYSFVLAEGSNDLQILVDGSLHSTIKANGEIHNASGSKYITEADFNSLFDARLGNASIDGGGAASGPVTPDFDGGTASTTTFEYSVDGGDASTTSFADAYEGGNAAGNSITEGGSAGTTVYGSTVDGGIATTTTFDQTIDGGAS